MINNENEVKNKENDLLKSFKTLYNEHTIRITNFKTANQGHPKQMTSTSKIALSPWAHLIETVPNH
jgi:hypothetical protein